MKVIDFEIRRAELTYSKLLDVLHAPVAERAGQNRPLHKPQVQLQHVNGYLKRKKTEKSCIYKALTEALT